MLQKMDTWRPKSQGNDQDPYSRSKAPCSGVLRISGCGQIDWRLADCFVKHICNRQRIKTTIFFFNDGKPTVWKKPIQPIQSINRSKKLTGHFCHSCRFFLILLILATRPFPIFIPLVFAQINSYWNAKFLAGLSNVVSHAMGWAGGVQFREDDAAAGSNAAATTGFGFPLQSTYFCTFCSLVAILSSILLFFFKTNLDEIPAESDFAWINVVKTFQQALRVRRNVAR